ncbi:MAG: DUF86 domain-containing protein [Bdellovibrionales bacterium]|nr:DUF86 domain-containing protein [Bdellovibrionales bacterium]
MKKQDDVYLREILDQISKIEEYIKGKNQKSFMKSSLHQAAVVRSLEVIGEAARQVSEQTRTKFSEIPWNQMIGMRNRLIHGYFDVDYEIVWQVAKHELTKLSTTLEKSALLIAQPIHPWRQCPHGYYHVVKHPRVVPPSPKNPGGITDVREHCRKNPSGKDQLYPQEMDAMLDRFLQEINGTSLKALPQFPGSNAYDQQILFWTKYWNEVLAGASENLDPNLIKALMGSESDFNPRVKPVRIGKGNFARGLMQITDQTRKILANEKGELKDHFLTLSAKDLNSSSHSICASIRWLFHKKQMASRKLGRPASWIEAIGAYKSYLGKKAWPNQAGMKKLVLLYTQLGGKPN